MSTKRRVPVFASSEDPEGWLRLYESNRSGVLAAQAQEPDPAWIAEWAASLTDRAIVEYRRRVSTWPLKAARP
jgi:hypothetical protein